MSFIDRFIQKKIIEPAVRPFQDKIKEQDKIIKIQQDKIPNSPQHFALPFGIQSDLSGGSIRPWKKIIDFKTLRVFSERYDVARACINRRKRQVEGVDWWIEPVNKSEKAEKYKSQIELLTDFLKMPGGKFARFKEFTNELIEDLLVLDAGVVWKEKTRGGRINKLVTVDSSTIRLRVMGDGSTPEPPDKAFEQWIQGKKVADFTTDEMIYLMMNPRSNTPYGLSPLECLVLGVDAALRSQLYNLNMLTEGNIPEGFLAVPDTWSPQQIKEFEMWFNAKIAGNPREQQRIKIIPGGKGGGYTPTKKPDEMRFLEYEKWLLLKTCAIFDIPPHEIGFTEKLPLATAKSQHEVALKFGLTPMLETLKEFFNMIIQEDFGFKNLEFMFHSLDKKDELREAKKFEKLVPLGIVSVDEVRQQNDLEPIGLPHYIKTPSGPVLVKDILKNSESNNGKGKGKEKEKDDDGSKEIKELEQWRRKSLGDFKAKRKFRSFESQFIGVGTKELIKARLCFVKTRNDVRKIFDEQIDIAKSDYIFKEAHKLKDSINETLKGYELATET